MTTPSSPRRGGAGRSPWQRPPVLAGLSLAAILLFFILREHWGHVLGFAPYLILLMCPLMHFFMHGSHGHGHGAHHRDDTRHDQTDRP